MNNCCKTLGITLLIALGHNAYAENLLEIYQKAKLNDPAIREAEANMFAEMQTKPQVRAELLPQLTGNAGWQNQDSDGRNSVPRTFLTPGGEPEVQFVNQESERDVDITTWDIQLSQSLLDTEQWRRLKKADKEVAQAQIDYQVAQQDLMVRVSEAYFDVLAAQDTLASERASKDSIARQLEQAERRFEVGLIAITDVKEAQAAFDDAVALEISAQRSLATAKEALREITGEYPQELANPGTEFPLIPPSPKIEQEWVDISMQQNLALASAEIGTEITREDIRIARGGRWPTVTFDASYGNFQQDGDNTIFTDEGSNTSPIDTDQDQTQFGVNLRVPFYTGGRVSADVQEKVYRHRAARENYEKVARSTERETRDAYLGVIAEIARVQALARSEESNKTALEATEAGYEVGTRTTVDVLDARRSLFLAQTQYARSKYDYLINVVKLKQAAGTLNEDDIALLNTWLVTDAALPETPGRGITPDVDLPASVVEPGGITAPIDETEPENAQRAIAPSVPAEAEQDGESGE
jgi:outer membrane protein